MNESLLKRVMNLSNRLSVSGVSESFIVSLGFGGRGFLLLGLLLDTRNNIIDSKDHASRLKSFKKKINN